MTEPLRILILEDNPTDAELIQFELQDAGIVFTAKVVMTEQDFVRELQQFSPDLILSDYDLPKYNGALALAEAKRRCPDIPFILVTGAVTEDRAIDILTKGAKDYVLKTRLEQRLAPAVKRALAEAEEHRARKKAEADLREAHRTLEDRVRVRTAELEAEIEARKKADEAMAAAQRQVQSIIDNTTSIIYAFDLEGRFLMANAAVAELLNSTPEQMIGKRRHEFMPKDDADLHEANDRQVIKSGKAMEFEEYSRLKGRSITWLTTKFPLRDAQGRIYAAAGISADVSPHKHAEEALRESEERFRALVTASSEVLYRMNPDWSEMRRLTSRSFLANTEKPSSTWLQEYIHPDDQPYVTSVINEAVRTKSIFELEHRVKRADGGIGWTHSRAVPLMDKNGEIVEWFGAASDISERKRSEP